MTIVKVSSKSKLDVPSGSDKSVRTYMGTKRTSPSTVRYGMKVRRTKGASEAT